MSSEEIEHYYRCAYELIVQAGELFRQGFFGSKDIVTKAALYDETTQYDVLIEELLRKGLAKEFPDHKFIGEETSDGNTLPKLTNCPTWIIDPIDGTGNFIRKIPHACISIGLAINRELVAGLVFNPIADELFTARKGCGAFLNGKPIHVSNISEMKNALLVYEVSLIDSQFLHIRDKNIERIFTLGSNGIGTRSYGSAALSLCYVAMGRHDCYHIDDLKPWDMAGGVAIVREAGGVVYHTSGSEFNIMKPDIVCAATENLSQDVIRLIRDADKIDYKFA